MAFIDDAKELLTDEQFTKLQLLARKSADFETTFDEDKELAELKSNVKNLVAKRDAAKNLEFLKTGQYSIETIIELMKPKTYDLNKILVLLEVSKEKLSKSLKELYPTQKENLDIAIYQDGDKSYPFNLANRVETALSKLIQAGKEKAFANALTEQGKIWILQNHISEKGKFKGETIYPNLSIICTKLKFDKKTLLNELNEKAEKEETKKKK